MIRMLANVQQKTIQPVITATVAPDSLIHTDEYDIYARLPAWGYRHKTVCHSRGEYARDEDGDGFCEVHPWTAPGAQGKNAAFSANHGRVQPSIRPGIAAHMAAGPDDNSPLRSLSRQRTLCPMHPAGWTELGKT